MSDRTETSFSDAEWEQMSDRSFDSLNARNCKLNEKLARMEEDLKKLRDEIRRKDQMSMLKDKIIQNKDKLIKKKDKVLLEKDEVILEKDAIISNKDKIIEEKDEVIMEKEEVIAGKDVVIMTKNVDGEEIKKLLKKMENEIALLKSKVEEKEAKWQDNALKGLITTCSVENKQKEEVRNGDVNTTDEKIIKILTEGGSEKTNEPRPIDRFVGDYTTADPTRELADIQIRFETEGGVLRWMNKYGAYFTWSWIPNKVERKGITAWIEGNHLFLNTMDSTNCFEICDQGIKWNDKLWSAPSPICLFSTVLLLCKITVFCCVRYAPTSRNNREWCVGTLNVLHCDFNVFK